MSEPPGAAGNPPADVGCPSISRSDWPDKWRSGNGDIGWGTIAHIIRSRALCGSRHCVESGSALGSVPLLVFLVARHLQHL